MLACLGPVVFDIVNDLQGIDDTSESSFARHDIMGGAVVYEPTGEEEGTFTLKGKLHPNFFDGALIGLAALEQARRAKVPLPLMGGDFVPRGWVLIQSISRSDSELDALSGVGNEVDYTVKLLKVGTPGGGMAETILRIFLG